MAIIESHTYQIYIDEKWDYLNSYINSNEFSTVYVLVDQNSEKYCLPIFIQNIERDFQLLSIQSGEENKNLETCQKLWSQLLVTNADRKSLVINLGGGVIGDMGGFVASCYMRGIKFVQIPTTLLAQVDASVGGKLGVDLLDTKNIIGLFNDLELVWIHTPFLKTLSEREIKSGFAEIIKHAIISNRKNWEDILTIQNFKDRDWTEIVAWNVSFKNEIVSRDLKESGLRKILNFGHTIGHAIESVFLKTEKKLLHGEAVALGIILETKLATQLLWLPQEDQTQIQDFIERTYQFDILELETHKEEIINYIKSDKKNENGKLLFSLIDKIGSPVYDIEISEEEAKSLLG